MTRSDGNPEFLLASEVALHHVNGPMAEQEPNLVEFGARQMAETGAGSPRVGRRQLVDAGASRRADDV